MVFFMPPEEERLGTFEAHSAKGILEAFWIPYNTGVRIQSAECPLREREAIVIRCMGISQLDVEGPKESVANSQKISVWEFDDKHMCSVHLKIYSIASDDAGVNPLICLENVSNRAIMRRDWPIAHSSGVIVLSDGDMLRVSSSFSLKWKLSRPCAMRVSSLLVREEMRHSAVGFSISICFLT